MTAFFSKLIGFKDDGLKVKYRVGGNLFNKKLENPLASNNNMWFIAVAAKLHATYKTKIRSTIPYTRFIHYFGKYNATIEDKVGITLC